MGDIFSPVPLLHREVIFGAVPQQAAAPLFALYFTKRLPLGVGSLPFLPSTGLEMSCAVFHYTELRDRTSPPIPPTKWE